MTAKSHFITYRIKFYYDFSDFFSSSLPSDFLRKKFKNEVEIKQRYRNFGEVHLWISSDCLCVAALYVEFSLVGQ